MLCKLVTRMAFVALVTTFGLAASARESDPHLSTSPARELFLRSALAHGYMHGYEAGFHVGDLDIHLGRGNRPIAVIPEADAKNAHFQREYGNRSEFRLGYERGFAAGYEDAVSNREFVADGIARSIADGLNELPTTANPAFSSGFAKGFTAAYQQHGAYSQTMAQAGESCRQQAVVTDMNTFCSGYARGYTFAVRGPATGNSGEIAQKIGQ